MEVESVEVKAPEGDTVAEPIHQNDEGTEEKQVKEELNEEEEAPKVAADNDAIAADAQAKKEDDNEIAQSKEIDGEEEPFPASKTTGEEDAKEESAKASSKAKIHVDLLSPNAAPPSGPKDRDIIFGEGEEGHKANLLLQDLIALHKLVWKCGQESPPKEESDVEVVTERLFQLMKKGKGRDLAGMKDVPRPFLVGSGRFLLKDGGDWKELSDDEARKLMRTTVFTAMNEEDYADASNLKELNEEFLEFLEAQSQETEAEQAVVEPKPTDVILLQRTDSGGDKFFNNQSGNKALFTLASQHVNSEVSSQSKRLEAALSVFLSKGAETKDGTKPDEGGEKPRFILCTIKEDEQKVFSLVKPVDAAEVTLLFVFEVWLEKEHAAKRDAAGLSSADSASHDYPEPSTDPIDTPTAHDVLFGRGGMTNSHPGNKRFRDVIALHRPDYIKAIKNDKPNVARRIVRAIRTASPPGRFLKKCDDGKWRDVGDKVAAEKASQALREKSNAEKRQRSAQREAMRGKREGGSETSSPSKKSKTSHPAADISITSPLLAPQQLNYVGAPLASATQNLVSDASTGDSKVVKADGKEELKTQGLPPNAVDKDGNILVTDFDILCGRGGLTNHHRGNKRFRDIVALHRPDYIRAPKVQKPSVARVIVRAIRNGDPPGRFLRKDDKTGKWIDIGDKKAAEKTSQALREKGGEKERGGAPSSDAEAAPPAASPAPAFLLPSPTVGAVATPGALSEGGAITDSAKPAADDSKEPEKQATDDSKEIEKQAAEASVEEQVLQAHSDAEKTPTDAQADAEKTPTVTQEDAEKIHSDAQADVEKAASDIVMVDAEKVIDI